MGSVSVEPLDESQYPPAQYAVRIVASSKSEKPFQSVTVSSAGREAVSE